MSFAAERGMQILAGAYMAGATFAGRDVAIDAAVAKMAQPVDASEARELLMALEMRMPACLSSVPTSSESA